MMKILLFFSLLIALALQVSVQVEGSASVCPICAAPITLDFAVAGDLSPWRPRLVTSVKLNTLLGVGQIFKSAATVQAQGEVDLDAIKIAVSAVNGLIAPTISLGYFQDVADVSIGIGGLLNLNLGLSIDVSAAYSFIAHKLSAIEEFNPITGQVLNTISLKALSWSVVARADVNTNVPYLAIAAKANGAFGSLGIELDFVVANQSATITANANGAKLDTLLGPKGLQIMVALDLKNYVYVDVSNLIRLVSFTATGPATTAINVASTNALSLGAINSYISASAAVNVNDNNQGLVGVRFAGSAQLSVLGLVNVGVSFSTSADIGLGFLGDAVSQQISNILGSTAVLTRADVVIQAPGFKDVLVYSTTVTSGPDPTISSSLSN